MDKEILEMFNKKNKDMLINNLQYDMNRNIDMLIENLINLSKNEFDIAKKNIGAIFEDSIIDISDKHISDSLDQCLLDLFEKITILINQKKNVLNKKLDELKFEESIMKEYYEFVSQTTEKLKLELETLLNGYFNQIKDKIEINLDDKLDNDRLDNYLNNRLLGKLFEKVSDTLSVRDINLINKARESYEKYIDLTNKLK